MYNRTVNVESRVSCLRPQSELIIRFLFGQLFLPT